MAFEVQTTEDNSQEPCEKHLKKRKKMTGNLHEGILMAADSDGMASHLTARRLTSSHQHFLWSRKRRPPFNPTTNK